MNIDRYNYEEFFLLYTDNELSISERLQVEQFIIDNPDLAKELQLLQQSVLQPEADLKYANKESLMHNEANTFDIHPANCEELFVLYADDELSNSEKARVEQFVYENPRFQEDFELIQKLRLTPETGVLFPDKKSLYRYERRDKPSVFPLWRVPAAAVMILIAGLLWFFNQRALKSVNDVAREDVKKYLTIPKDSQKTGSFVKQPDTPLHEAGEQKSAPVGTPGYIAGAPKKAGKQKTATALSTRSPIKPRRHENFISGALAADEKESAPAKKYKAIDPVAARIRKDKKPDPVKLTDPGKIDKSVINKSGLAVGESLTGQVTVGGSKAEVVSFASPDFASSESSETVIFTNIPVTRKNTLRGIFRKASRFIDKTIASKDPDKKGVLIGNIEIAFQ